MCVVFHELSFVILLTDLDRLLALSKTFVLYIYFKYVYMYYREKILFREQEGKKGDAMYTMSYNLGKKIHFLLEKKISKKKSY